MRQVKRGLKKVDTSLEVLERRLDKLLERESLITIEAWDSFLKNYDTMYKNIQEFERLLTNVMIIFRLLT